MKAIFTEVVTWCREGCEGIILEQGPENFIKTSRFHVRLPNKRGRLFPTLAEAQQCAVDMGCEV